MTPRMLKAIIAFHLLSLYFCTPYVYAVEYEIDEKINLSYYPKGHENHSELTQVNLLIPKGVENPPVLIWIGGGAWAYVNRHNEMDLSRQIAKRGILVVSAGHRLSPALLGEEKHHEGIQHPEHIKDIARAFKWVYDQAEVYGYSTDNIFVGGFSSGAHLSTLLVADKRYLAEYGLTPANVNAIIPVAGGYDIPEYRDLLVSVDPSYEQNHIHAVFGSTNEDHIDASPITYIEDFNTTMLLFSESDTFQYSFGFEQQLRDRGFRDFQVVNAYDETHASLWTKMSHQENYGYRNLLVDFILSHVRRDN
ncbi:alpha/beta hydrolase [Alteromonas sp. ASW11-36]|uniref:Alpha/beta hydrolase n=1 Tax=Alteromonas arenosi TaxID=3055817 RepID=A0ABT7SX59_9ALTE|nr:alpha/beta hydrolase [Alteromonas sp. ASW11-36]MDM7860765.1 alpha/beta hydrolase [Alteromonas sp. ASW11-36]